MGSGLRKEFADLQATLSVFLEWKRRGECSTGFSFGRQIDGCRLAGKLFQSWLRVECVDVRWTAIQKEMDDTFNSARVMGRLDSDTPFGEFSCSLDVASFLIIEQTGQGECTQPHPRPLQQGSSRHRHL